MKLADSLVQAHGGRILLVVLDGLGGVPVRGRTELEAARTPNLDKLADASELGLVIPVEIGVTPGSGPAHLALFGYDPVEYQVGRGVIEALGVGLDVKPGDLCCRANFATLGPDGKVADRRAGRIENRKAEELCTRLQQELGRIEDIEVIVRPGREHRFVVAFRGQGLEQGLTDSDPLHEAEEPLAVRPLRPEAGKSARVANQFVKSSASVLQGEERGNFVLLRGLATLPALPRMQERFRLNPGCVAVYPMYRGLAKLVGMELVETADTWEAETQALRKAREEYDFLFVHFKETDKAGEDGDFDAKVKLIERFDRQVVPGILDAGFDVVCITGDHSTPAVLGGHSWHAVPLLVHSRYVRPGARPGGFGERACASGSLGQFHTRHLMALLLAHALRLKKFGA